MMPIVTDAAFILPDDFADAALMGRIWRPDLASPSVVAIRPDGVFDITEDFPTASQLAGIADPAAALRAAQCRFSRSIRKPGRASRRLHAGCRPGRIRHPPS